jgi:signal peptidase I
MDERAIIGAAELTLTAASGVAAYHSPAGKRPVRDNIESFAIAILFAVLLKPFLLEAYVIPTPSMQPTMMGCPPAGVHDRLIVDKWRYAMAEPERWDIAVFRYPIREIQSYVKRIVGIGGDRFRIAGGNLVPVDKDGKELPPLRKPRKLEEDQWKELFPARMALDGKQKILDGYFSAQPAAQAWTDDGSTLRLKNERGRSATLNYVDTTHGGLCDRIYDGYPTSVARAMRGDPQTMGGNAFEGVADIRARFTLQASAVPDDVAIEINVAPTAKPAQRYELQVDKAGQGRLVIKVGGKEVKASEAFACAVAAGDAIELGLTHVDGVLKAEHDGTVVAELPCHPHLVLDPVRPEQVSLILAVRGGEQLEFSDLTVERDIQYKPGTLGRKGIIEIPAGHFMMMGDNPDQSADAREWKAITVAVLDGRVVDPQAYPTAPKLIGNFRPKGISDPVDADENPVLVPSREAVVFTDLRGEVHTLRGKPSLATGKTYGPDGIWFEGEKGPWQPLEHAVPFVPREHVLGRPVLNFWPLGIWRPFRAGPIR